MKSRRLPSPVRLALMAAAVAALSACAPSRDYAYERDRAYYYEPEPDYYEPAEYYAPRAEYYDYWYYPAIGAYYDPRVSVYFYYEHDHWVRSRALPPHYRSYLDHHVTVRSPHDRPYAEHNRHRQRYAPEQYRREHYKQPAHDRRNNDAWIGAPRQSNQERDRYERRQDNRDRNDRNQAHDRDYDRRSASAEPQQKAPARVIRKEPARDKYRANVEPRGNQLERKSASVPQQHRERAPAAKQPPPKVRTQEIRDQRAPAVGTAPVKQQGRTPARENRKEAAQNGNRKGDERRGDPRNRDDEDSTQRPRGPDVPQAAYR